MTTVSASDQHYTWNNYPAPKKPQKSTWWVVIGIDQYGHPTIAVFDTEIPPTDAVRASRIVPIELPIDPEPYFAFFPAGTFEGWVDIDGLRKKVDCRNRPVRVADATTISFDIRKCRSPFQAEHIATIRIAE